MTITNRVSLKSVMAGNTPIADVVDAPTIGTATADFESATVTFTAAATGGEATSFGAISTPGSVTGTSATSPITVSGLTGGTAYTFKTYGINSSGTWSNVLSAASNSVTPTGAVGLFESISSTTVGSGGSGSITFSSIPQTYRHLQIRMYSAANNNSDVGYNTISMNGSPSGLRNLIFKGGSGTIANYADTSLSGLTASLSNVYFDSSVIDILDYTSTNKNKTVRYFGGVAQATDGALGLNAIILSSTSAITSLTIAAYSSFQQYSCISLYGIKDA